MHNRSLTRSLVAVVALTMMSAAGCAASESVTIADGAAARATSTARDQQSPTEPAPNTTPAAPPVDAAPDSTPPPPVPTEPSSPARPTPVSTIPAGESGCTYLGVDTFDDMQIELAFTSDLPEQDDAFLNYSVSDGDVEIVNSETFIEDLAPGEQVRMAADTITDAPADDSNITCAFLGIEPFEFGDPPFRPGPGDECVFVEIDFAGDIQVRLDFANPLTGSNEIAIDFALRADGVRFGDGVTFAEVTNDGRITLDTDTFTDPPTWLGAQEITCDILAIESFD